MEKIKIQKGGLVKNLSKIFIVAMAFLSSASGESAVYTKNYNSQANSSSSSRNTSWSDTKNLTNSKYTSTSENTPASDEHIAKKIRWLLHNDASLSNESKTVQVNVNGGKVRLTGAVNNADDKNKIESLVKQVNGVTSVSNELNVSTR